MSFTRYIQLDISYATTYFVTVTSEGGCFCIQNVKLNITIQNLFVMSASTVCFLFLLKFWSVHWIVCVLCDWFTGLSVSFVIGSLDCLSVSFVIGQSDYFGVGFMTINWKPLQITDYHRRPKVMFHFSVLSTAWRDGEQKIICKIHGEKE